MNLIMKTGTKGCGGRECLQSHGGIFKKASRAEADFCRLATAVSFTSSDLPRMKSVGKHYLQSLPAARLVVGMRYRRVSCSFSWISEFRTVSSLPVRSQQG